MTMLLKRAATEKELRDGASLEAWTLHSVLEKGGIPPVARAFFMREMATACASIADGINPVPAPVRLSRKEWNAMRCKKYLSHIHRRVLFHPPQQPHDNIGRPWKPLLK